MTTEKRTKVALQSARVNVSQRINYLRPENRKITCVLLFLLLTFSALTTSCVTTVQYVADQPEMLKKYAGKSVDEVEFEFGKPNARIARANGYEYKYDFTGRSLGNGQQDEAQHVRFLFGSDDKVLQVASTRTVARRRPNPGGIATLAAVVILVPIALFAALFAAAN